MKKITFLAFLLFCGTTYAQDYVYTIDLSYDQSLSTTACNVFATTTKVDNLNHKTTIGFPTFVGNPDYYINLPCRQISSTVAVGTEYQILFPFKAGNTYEITALYRGVRAGNEIFPNLAFGFNETEKTHNTSTSCTGPQAVNLADYNFIAASGASFSWLADDRTCKTGVLTKSYASLSVAAVPFSLSPSAASVQVRTIQIREWCNQPALGAASGLTGTLTVTTPPAYGYTLNFNPVPGAEEYLVEWYDVTNSALAGTFTISGPGYLNTANIISGHTYRYRVQAKAHCRSTAAFSDWSPELPPLGATCEYGPLPSTLGFTLQCYGCTTFNLHWPAVPGAVNYKVEYTVFQPSGILKHPATVYTTGTSINASTTILLGSNWHMIYRVAVDCGSGFGSFSDYSPTYLLKP
ncbi:hypothetical protein [Longitalea arenae]|uniref:hypothetical protein n=1 Tax=Longitalea arenae TaxID=2812558 RepID=UPI00196868A4|nr:hypothetical protein [Longitalea arenae]